jgi:hypothetical protein
MQNYRQRSITILIFFIAQIISSARGVNMEIRYAVPTFAMKLIILDNNVSLANFQSALDDIVHIHVRNYVQYHLPDQPGELERTSFVDFSLESTIDRTPINLEEGIDSPVQLSVIRSAFEGFSLFSYTEEFVAMTGINASSVQDEAHLTPFLLDSFRQHKGFWEFAELIIDDEVLGTTGKVQISVNSVLVAEADLLNDTPEVDNGSDLTPSMIGIISVSCVVFACIVGVAFAVCYLRYKEKEMERKSKERREFSLQFRNKSLGSSSSLGQSISSNSDSSWMDLKTRAAYSVPNRSEKGSMSSSRGKTWDSNKISTSEILLDIIEEEPTNYDDVTSRYSDKISTRSPEHDPDDSEFYSVRSCSSHVEDNSDSWRNKNAIVAATSLLNAPSPSSPKKATGVPILKPALKYTSTDGNSSVGRPGEKVLQSCLKNGSARKLGSGISTSNSPKRRPNPYRKNSIGGGASSLSHLQLSTSDFTVKCANVDPAVGSNSSPPRSPIWQDGSKRIQNSLVKTGIGKRSSTPAKGPGTQQDVEDDTSFRFGDESVNSLSPRKVKNGMGLSESWSFA